jgi:cytochrome d ubiquinol oxidase subunit I
VELALAPETLARWQFGITTVYHFLFVPLTISLAALTAILETAWVRTGKEHYLRATKFWGKLFLINIAMGVVTGIVQEFQFGMNWSDYSRFVGDVFGAPLAFEALIAFFFESTFIGLWIFGWDKLPKKVHLACIWVVSIGTILSAYFIMAANSFMQHPVGYRLVKKADGTMRAELVDFPKVLFQETALVNFWHVISASILVGGAFMTGIAVFHLRKKRHVRTMRMSLRLGLITALVGTILTVVSADTLGKVMYEQQPMKMSAAEALWDSQQPAPFSLFAYGDVAKGHNTVAIEIPSDRMSGFMGMPASIRRRPWARSRGRPTARRATRRLSRSQQTDQAAPDGSPRQMVVSAGAWWPTYWTKRPNCSDQKYGTGSYAAGASPMMFAATVRGPCRALSQWWTRRRSS